MERGVPLIERVIAQLSSRAAPKEGKRSRVSGVAGAAEIVRGATPAALDALESKLMVELPPTLRAFLAFDFTFASFGPKWKGRGRFGEDPRAPRPKLTSVRKLAEAMVEQGFTDSRIKAKVIRLPNYGKEPWLALYLGEARRDGELPILSLSQPEDDSHVVVAVRYSSFDLYLAEQCGLGRLPESVRLEDLESHLAANRELDTDEEVEESDDDY